MQTILVTDNVKYWSFLEHIAPVVKATSYISSDAYTENSIRVINLCSSYQHQSIGYYVSLLAQARDHKVIPSPINIQDTLSTSLTQHISQEIEEEIEHSLKDIKGNQFIFSLYFGQNMAKKYQVLAKKLHGLFPLPLIRFELEKKKQWQIKKIFPITLDELPEHHHTFIREAAQNYFSKKRFHQWQKKQKLHDLAILIDPDETHAPSNKKALECFVSVAEHMGLNVDLIDKNDSRSIGEYDALFIRTTTAVDHYTYRFARRAAQENLVVIDDPQSIVKCSNKVYLAELLRTHKVLTPETIFISKFDKQLPNIEFPCILKKPDSAFSQGVIKVDDVKSLQRSLHQFFKTSDLVLIQPFIPTEFDWRIGIIDNKPLFACRYHMAKNHWQIFNWECEQSEDEDLYVGDADGVPLDEVPEGVIKTALRATKLIGDSLYGVDIKSFGNKHYVIEINDNPSIDFGYEDQILKENLYEQIIGVFLQRIRRKHGYV